MEGGRGEDGVQGGVQGVREYLEGEVRTCGFADDLEVLWGEAGCEEVCEGGVCLAELGGEGRVR